MIALVGGVRSNGLQCLRKFFALYSLTQPMECRHLFACV